MLRTRRLLLSGLIVPVAAALAVGTASAQTTPVDTHRPFLGPVTFDGYYSHYRLDADGGRFGMDGVGARLMWSPGASRDPSATPPRAAVGLFAEFAPKHRGFSMLHAGLQGDVRLTRTPLGGLVEPVASLGAGLLRTDVNSEVQAEQSGFPLATRDRTTFALTPAVGVRFGLWRQLGLRADVRDVVTFRDETLHNVQYAAGVSFPF